jgi:hypothetical protein
MDPGPDLGGPKTYGSGGSGSSTLVFRRKRRGERAIPEVPGTRLCCGSDTVFSDSELSPTGNFTRQAAGENIILQSFITVPAATFYSQVTVKKTQIWLMKNNIFRKLCSALFIF